MRIDRKSDGEFIPQRSETARERLDATHVPMFLLGCARWSLRQRQFQRGTIEAFTFKAVWERMEHEPEFVLIPIGMGFGVPSMTTTILSSNARTKSFLAYKLQGFAHHAGDSGDLGRHHRFVWPAFGLLVASAVWRLVVRGAMSRAGLRLYLILMLLASYVE